MDALTLPDDGRSVRITLTGRPDGYQRHLATYVYRPDVPEQESPRPYLHPLHTLGGTLVTDFRPADHRWHHGVSLALPYVGPANLWGGPTWVREQAAYVPLPINGSMRHERFTALGCEDVRASLGEDLTWHERDGRLLAREHRDLSLTVAPTGTPGWWLTWRSVVVNATNGPLAFGSPATHGRVGAGYGGIFWRAAPAFADAAVRVPGAGGSGGEGTGVAHSGEELMGTAAPWMAYTTRADASAPGAATVVMLADGGAQQQDTRSMPRWFARSQEYPGCGPAPFGEHEGVLAPRGTVELACRMVVLDGVDLGTLTG